MGEVAELKLSEKEKFWRCFRKPVKQLLKSMAPWKQKIKKSGVAQDLCTLYEV